MQIYKTIIQKSMKWQGLIIKHLAVIWAVADITSEKKGYDLKKR